MSKYGICTVGADGRAINSLCEGDYDSLGEAESAAQRYAQRARADERGFMGAVGVRAWDADSSDHGACGATFRFDAYTPCGVCEKRPDEVNHPQGMVFIGWGRGWERCVHCDGAGYVLAGRRS